MRWVDMDYPQLYQLRYSITWYMRQRLALYKQCLDFLKGTPVSGRVHSNIFYKRYLENLMEIKDLDEKIAATFDEIGMFYIHYNERR